MSHALGQQLDLAAMQARREGLHEAAAWIERNAPKRADQAWALGSCVWCAVEQPPRRRKAVAYDQGGGPPTCAAHAAGADEAA